MSGGRPPSAFFARLPGTWGDWRRQARCRDMDTAVFFPETPGDRAGEAAAKRVCAACPVVAACREGHMREPYGVFGGLNEFERRALRRRRSERQAG